MTTFTLAPDIYRLLLLLTNVVIETQERASEFAFALHYHPYFGSNTLINKFLVDSE